MKYKKKHLGTLDGFDIYIVDGTIIRNWIFEDFTVGGVQEDEIHYWIDADDILIDNHIREDEYNILIKRFLFLKKACRKGENADVAIERIYEKERKYRKQISPTKKVSQKLITKIGSLNIVLVDGREVRDHLDVEFACGGNDCAYNYVSKETIWFDVNFADEFTTILFHEMVERNKILSGENYFQAHEESNTLGDMYLDEPEKMKQHLLDEFKKSLHYSQKGIHSSKKHYHSMNATFD